jgi:tetratricopeptide (TPR) repeat protein
MVLPVTVTFEVKGEEWTTQVSVDGSRDPLGPPEDLVRLLGVHLEGLIGELWLAPDRAAQHELARERHRELSAEAVAAVLLAAEGILGDWVIGDGADPAAGVDGMLGPVQGSALIWAALSVAGEDGPELAQVIERHVASGLVLPRAIDEVAETTGRLLGEGNLADHARLPVLAVHAAAHLAGDRPDPLAAVFTREWIAVAWQADEDPDDPRPRRLRVPAELLRQLIDTEVLAAAVVETTDAPPGWMERLQRIAEQAGQPRLIRQVAPSMEVLEEASADVFCEALSELAAKSEDPRALVEGLRFVLASLRSANRIDELEPITDHALGLCGENPVIRALLLAQFGAAAKDARVPAVFLGKVGEVAEPWEEELPDGVRLALQTERASALRIAGRPREAEAILQGLIEAPLDQENRWVTEFNLSMVARDGGAADAGMRSAEDLLARAPDDGARFLAHQSLARTMTAVGRHEEAVAHLRAAIDLAVGRYGDQAPVLRAALVSLLAAEGDVDGAKRELAALDALDAESLSAQARLGVADGVTVLLELGEELDADLVERVRGDLRRLRERARADGDFTVESSSLRIRAVLHQLLGDADAAAADWEALLAIVRDPLALVSLATLRRIEGKADDARGLMVELPEALLAEHGGAADIGAILDATGRVRAAMRQLSTVMMGQRPVPSDVRLAAELSRDAIGRMRAWASSEVDSPSRSLLADGLANEALLGLAPESGAVWVLEWWEASQGVVSLLTRITSEGTVATRALPAMPADAPAVAEEVLARLQDWWPGRPGDPLAHSGWQELTTWLREAMSDAPPGDHLAIVEHQGLVGLPWHAIDGAAWTTSYSPGWSALLDMQSSSPREPEALGMVSVPARGEADGVVRVFAEDLDRARSGAERRGLSCEVLEGAAAEAPAVLALMSRSDLAVLACHGLIDPEGLDLSLLVSHAGQLPTRHPIAAASPYGRAHRLGWRSLQAVTPGPGVVLSAACSSGQGLIGGLGERLGLFGALRSRGTRAVVAPAWDAIAADVVVQLAEIREMLLDGVALGEAAKRAGDRAEQRLPTWRARILAIDGDWR